MQHKILVVDDEEDIVEGTKRLLEKKGYAVCTAYNGLEGLEKVRNERPDLILTDVIMPEMDGFAFYKELKKDKVAARIPVLIVTARGPMEDTFKVFGADGFISKPFSPEELIKQIEHVLNITSSTNSKEAGVKKVQTKRILVAGKDQNILDEMVMEARRAGYDVETIKKGAEAITKAVQFLPDMVFMDVQMEDMPCGEIVDILRRLPKFENKPIVGYSYYKTEEFGNSASRQKILDIKTASEQFLEAGGNEYIGRFNSHNFINAAIKILGQ